jgi:mRNA-degrading endonuclease RelE of RelBE toxin-antitoxin system
VQFRISDTFTDSLARLTAEEQKAVKTTVFDLQVHPENPGHQYHKLDRAKDKCFWSVRVSRDVRIIVHRDGASVLLCYVDHHDRAYAWAERRKLETHSATGAAQLVEIRERVQEIVVPVYAETRVSTLASRVFDRLSDDELLGYGVPAEWLADVRGATEDTVLSLADHLPQEAAEALLELATGGRPQPARPTALSRDPFEHPDAQRRFRVMTNREELERALEYPWDKWTVFLHPAQQEWVQRDCAGPARVSGSAGTGKTIVALHRAVHLARRDPDARVLLTTFSEILANALRTKLKRLIDGEPRLAERVEVHAIDAIGERLYRAQFGAVNVIGADEVQRWLQEAAAELGERSVSGRFLAAEWDQVVDAWRIASWEEYRDVRRLGRKTRLSEARRRALWNVFERAVATGSGRTDDARRAVRQAGRRGRAAQATAVRSCRGRRVSGLERLAPALPRGAGRRPYERALLHGRSRAEDLSAAVLVEDARVSRSGVVRGR